MGLPGVLGTCLATEDAAMALPPTVVTAQSAHHPDALEALRLRLGTIEAQSGAHALAVGVYDTETRLTFRYNADRWFHAASTIKVAILVGVYGAIYRGWLRPYSRLHVRNRFMSIVDDKPFRVAADRDSNPDVHAAIGKML